VWLSVLIFLVATGSMAYLRLYIFHDRFITLTYGLPLLVCLWHRDRRLLWSMALVFSAMAYYKAFHVRPDAAPDDQWELVQWFFQVVNIVVIACSVHAIILFTDILRAKNLALEEANHELQAQAEELAQQNEEIQRQSEELSQQNEEVNQQNEELQQQSQELEVQSEELKGANTELGEREAMLTTLLKTAVSDHGHSGLEEVCDIMLKLMGRVAQCATVAERNNGELVVLAKSGLLSLERERWPFHKSLAAISIEHGRTASVHDLSKRPDLIVPRSREVAMRASLATPLRVAGEIVGVLEVHSAQEQEWTTRQFQLIEWAAAQCGLMLEITQLRRQLSRKNLELEKLVEERTAKLQELVNELEHFSYTITHDMRAPLRALQGFAGILAAECPATLDAKHTDYLDRIVQSSKRMDRLITDALSYSRAVRNDQPLGLVDTTHLLNGIIASYPAFQPPQARIEIRGPLPSVLANEAGLTQCFSNLLNNAVKFVQPGKQPCVVVRAESREGYVRLYVEDNGIGIPEAFVPRLFGMFQRYSKDYDGTGIGLALVRKVCERMGGRAGADSQLGIGSQFWIELQSAPGSQAETQKILQP
jgi:signal transduction histidine kinase